MIKLFSAFIFGCFVIGYAINRWISNQRNKNYGTRLIKALDATPEFADDIAADHQNQYAKASKVGTKSLQNRLAFIQKGQKMFDKYEIIGVYPLKNDGVLLVTICRNKEMGESEGSHVIKKYVFSFVMQHIGSAGEIEICSDYYELLNDRLLRQDFAKHLVQVIEQQG